MKIQCGVCTKECESQDTLLAARFFYCGDCDLVSVLPTRSGSPICIHCLSGNIVQITRTSDLKKILDSVELPFPCVECAQRWTDPFFFLKYMIEHGFLVAVCSHCGVPSLYLPHSDEAGLAQLTHPQLWNGVQFAAPVSIAGCKKCSKYPRYVEPQVDMSPPKIDDFKIN